MMNMKKWGKKILIGVLLCVLLAVGLCSCSQKGGSGKDIDFDEAEGLKIGVISGSIHDVVIEQSLKHPKVSYFATTTDLAIALETGKIDAYVCDEPVARILIEEYPGQKVVRYLTDENYAFAFQKNDEKAKLLCLEMNEFLKKCREDGTLAEIEAKWFNAGMHDKFVDMDGLTAENGVLTFATSTDIGAPLTYIKDNQYVGYDIDIAVRFCREYGYGIDIVNSGFDGMLASVSVGKSDFGSAGITVTPERSESMLFSEPSYSGGSVLIAKSGSAIKTITSIEELAGEKLGVQTGAAYDLVAMERIPDTKIVYYDSASNLATALEKGKVQAYLADEPIARLLIRDYPSEEILTLLKRESYAVAIPKVNPGSEKLRRQWNEFLENCEEDGTLKEVDEIWFGSDTARQVIDFGGLDPVNGTLSLATSTSIGAPFIYMKDNELAGYDLDLAVRFCRAYGYGLKITDCDLPGMMSCLASGKCDFSAGCISITEERKETMLFSDPYYAGGIVVIVNNSDDSMEETGFFASIGNSFYKTFIKEDRYQLFLSGILMTLLIVALSILFGTVLGFSVYLLYYRMGKVCRTAVNVLTRITENTPVVVILMILYYILFGSVDISGAVVSIIGFSLIFAGSVIGVMKVGVGAVDPGQREAALALGYTENETFMKVILPQAAVHFLPGYKSAIVQLIKGTAIVGYIAVQDLTKVSDIVRSRTYEAFFPLIVTAILYFLMAVGLSAIVKRIEIRVNPLSRKSIKMLKGVKRND